jgi:hypothetical protein
MDVLLILLLLLALSGAGFLAFQLMQAKAKLKEYGAITDIDAECAKRKKESERLGSEIDRKKSDAERLAREFREAEADLKAKMDRIRKEAAAAGEVSDLASLAAKLRKEVATLEEAEDLQSFGFYKRRYSFDASEEYRDRLDDVAEQQKDMLKDTGKHIGAAYCRIEWTVDGSKKEGAKMTKHFLRLILRAFNGECDAAIAKVKYNNANVQEARIHKAFEAINKLAETNKCEITDNYLRLKLKELYLTHEFHEKKREEQEEQRRIKEEMAEEQRALKELEKAQRDAEKQEQTYQKALEDARRQMEQATGKKHAQLEEKIAELQRRLQEAEEIRQRAVSQAQLTKIGHVYVISNIGSFGEDVYKIGMTRRLDPMDRVKELGDASVPFPFDVHAMIYSHDAPGLENALHKAFTERRLNKVNFRKEFFHVSLKEIETEARKHHAKVQFTKLAEAEEFRKSLAYAKEEGLDIGARAFVPLESAPEAVTVD